ncbi:hypothetical protein [Brumimicrobium oceani]|uniref:Uncharacterized protein n=1 Tax=Brumimicrobium oceani TaxID=2100725 RepID=A0A2U2XDR8_9FLAO|nr:hypothetical protein [Brumimicrobium oceani]PWH85880.1 hypothetical protein DIT68_07235 [Brumimicrobium oceani]
MSQQINYYSDNFYGGVTGAGFNPGYSLVNSSISFNIPNNSTIKKAFLFATSKKYMEEASFLDSITIKINGIDLSIGNQHAINNNYIYKRGFSPSDYIEHKTLVKDITYLSSILNQTPITVESTLQPDLPAIMHYYIIIL